MPHADWVIAGRVAVGFAVGFVLGYERQLRGSPAGDRTFSLIAIGATAVTAVAGLKSPQAVAGVITGLGFIGAGVVLNQGTLVRGVTTAATIFATAAIGIVIGYGHEWLGAAMGLVVLLVLELQHIPFLRFLDADRVSGRFEDDRVFKNGEDSAGG